MSEYAAAHLDEIEELDDGRSPWRPVRHHFGITAFGVNAWTAREAGDRIINEHDESDDGNEELYFVHTGRAVFEVGDERLEAAAGTFVSVPPGVKRTAFAGAPGTTVLAVGGVPGQAYVVDGWEVWEPLRQLYEAGDYETVVERGRGPIEAADYPVPLYNLACCESLTGRAADALEHLRQALAGSEQLRALAREDSDLDPIRGEPAFEELVSG